MAGESLGYPNETASRLELSLGRLYVRTNPLE